MSEHPKWAQDESICPCGEKAGPDFRYGLCDKHARETPAPTLLRMGATAGALAKEQARAEKAEGDRDFWRQRYDAAAKLSGDIESALAAARRECEAIRALIPPAAAPAAEPDVCVGSEYIGGYLVPRYAPAADYDPITAPIPEGDMNGPHGPLPKGETGKAQGAEADDTNVPDDIDPRNFEKYDADARQRIAELEAALREAQGQLCAEHCEWTGTGEHDDQCVKLSKALAARVAPPDREGK